MLPEHARAHTAAMVRMHRRINTATPRHAVPRQRPPFLIESDYARRLVAIIDRARAEVKPLLAALPAEIERAQATRRDGAGANADAATTGAARVSSLLDQVRRGMADSLRPTLLDSLARQMAVRTSDANRHELGRQVRAALGIDLIATDAKLPAILDGFAAENVALIQSLGNSTVDDIGKLATRALTTGRATGDVARDIAARFDVSERHARMIARDQIGKVNGQVNAMRQRELGISKFIWRTVGDERVRDEHDEFETQSEAEPFEFADPPVDESGEAVLPGEPICCRCSAEPVFDDILAAADGEDDEETPDESAIGDVAAAAEGVDEEVAAAGDGESGADEPPEEPPAPPPEPPEEPPSGPSTGGGETPESVPAAPEAVPEVFVPQKNPKRVEAAKKAGEASAERRREIHSAVKSNLHPDLHVAWDKEGHKFLKQKSRRIKGIKDPINAASKISEAFAETYGSGEASIFGNEGDRFQARAELEANHAETWADEQERAYYEEAQRAAIEAGETGDLTEQGREDDRRALEVAAPSIGVSNAADDDPPF